MHPKTRLIIIAAVVSVLVITPVVAIALGVGLGVGLSDSGSGSGGQAAESYTLQDTTITFGALTPARAGGVRLSARDVHIFASSYSGLGLLSKSSQVPAFWRITPTADMDNASIAHWILPKGLVNEGINASTPTPSTAGDAANLNRTSGTYTFLVEAFTKDNRTFKSAILTIKIDKTAANVGTFDPSNNVWVPLGRGVDPSKLDIDTIYLSTGIDTTKQRLGFSNMHFPKTVTVRHADATRPGGVVNLGFSNCSNILVTGINFVGNLTATYGLNAIVSFGTGSTNMAVRFCTGTFTAEEANEDVSFVLFAGCTNCEASDLYVYRLSSGIVDRQDTRNINITVTRFKMRQYYNNAIWVGNSVNMTIMDCVTMAAMRYTGYHIDHIQVADGAAPQGLKIIRHQMYKAEGNGGSQGFFGGSPNINEGFIDDGSGNGEYTGKPGNVLTITKQDRVTATTTTAKRYLIDQTLAAPNGVIHTAPFRDFTINGAAYTGFMRNVLYWRGGGGQSSVNAYTMIMVNPPMAEVAWTYFMGTLSDKGLNVTKFLSGPPVTTFIIEKADGTKLTGTGRTLITPVGGGGGFWPWQDAGVSYDYPTPIALRGASDLPQAPLQGPSVDIMGVDLPALWPATSRLSSMYVWAVLNNQPSYRDYYGGPEVKPANLIIDAASTVWNKANYTVSSMSFANGDPQLGPQGLEHITSAAWMAMSFNEVVARHVQALLPRVGGPLTSGSQDFGAFTRDGLWNDGSGKRPY